MQVLLIIMLPLLAFCAVVQEAGKPASGPLAAFNMAIAAVMKIPVTLCAKGKSSWTDESLQP